MKPAALDWIFLPYIIGLTLAPTAIRLEIAPQTAYFLLALFPFGPLAIALALIVLRSLFPVLRFDFGLSGGRWGSIIAILILVGHSSFALAFAARHLFVDRQFPDPVSAHWTLLLLPVLICSITIYVLVYLFSGKPLGPQHPQKQLDGQTQCK